MVDSRHLRNLVINCGMVRVDIVGLDGALRRPRIRFTRSLSYCGGLPWSVFVAAVDVACQLKSVVSGSVVNGVSFETPKC